MLLNTNSKPSLKKKRSNDYKVICAITYKPDKQIQIQAYFSGKLQSRVPSKIWANAKLPELVQKTANLPRTSAKACPKLQIFCPNVLKICPNTGKILLQTLHKLV